VRLNRSGLRATGLLPYVEDALSRLVQLAEATRTIESTAFTANQEVRFVCCPKRGRLHGRRHNRLSCALGYLQTPTAPVPSTPVLSPAAPVPPVSLPVTGGPAKTSSAWPLMAVTVAPIGIVLGSWLRGGFSGIEASSAGGDLAVDPGRTSLTTGTSNALSCLALAPCPWRCSFRYASSSRATSRAPTLLLR